MGICYFCELNVKIDSDMQYWVHINGVQRGPMQLDELIKIGVTRDTYVWREGLEDWIKASELPELAGFFVIEGNSVPTPVQPVDDNGEAGKSQWVADDTDVNQPQQEDANAATGQSYVAQQPAAVQQPSFVANSTFMQSPVPPCPPTNLAWAIIVTILCCQIFGIIAIVYAAQVKSKYDAGQYETAVKYSENSALWCKLGIAFGLVWATFYAMLLPFM